MALQIGAGIGLAVLLVVHQAFLRDTVTNTTLDLLHFSLHPWSTSRLALQIGLIAWHATVLGCGVLLLRAALAGWTVPRPGPGFAPPRSASGHSRSSCGSSRPDRQQRGSFCRSSRSR